MLIAGVFDDVDVRSEQRYDEPETAFTRHTFTIEHDFSDTFSVKLFVGRAVSDFTNPIQTTVTFDRQDADISTILTGFGNNPGQPGANATSWVVPNLNAVASLFDIYCNCDTGVPGGDFRLTSITNGSARGSNRFIREEDRAYYLQLNFRSVFAGFDYRSNIGLRAVNTKLYAEGYSSTGGGAKVWGTNEYDNYLPSLNLAVNLTETIMLRFGAAKVMARPQIGNGLAGTNYLVPTTSLAASGPNFTATIGNVDLDPFQATTYDLSLEWYFAPESLLSVAFFRKDIDTYIQIVRQTLECQQLTALNPSAFSPAFCVGACTPTQIFTLTSAVNTDGGPLEGFEISYQQPFSFLPAPFDNLGIQANYTQVTSEIDYCSSVTCTAFVTNDLVNLSPRAFNATLYYEDDRFSARVSAAYREGYLQNVPGRNGNALEGKKDTLSIDAASSFKVNDQMSITLEALNLTDEPNQQWVGDDNRQSTSVYHHTGRQLFFGFRYRF